MPFLYISIFLQLYVRSRQIRVTGGARRRFLICLNIVHQKTPGRL
jgi:hypothetical protein